MVQAAQGFKSQVEICLQNRTDPTSTTMSDCSNGSNGIAAAVTATVGKVASVSVNSGIITAVGTSEVDQATFILTPAVSATAIIWTKSGSCTTTGLC
ncbi:MAG: hypothetical protein LWW92_06955 [Rhodocyclales bacterium]|nr:hypothetical protein [Rhodocyclales bacterium]